MRSIKITDHFTCTSANVIYCITCTLCKKLYIGETERRLGDRFREHLRDVEKDDQNASKPVARHFNLPNHSKAPAKRSQHANSTYRNIVGRNMLRAFGHPVATCCDVLGVVGPNLTIFKLEPTTPNMSQHIATWWPNEHNMLRPTMLRYVALTCCDRLAGA